MNSRLVRRMAPIGCLVGLTLMATGCGGAGTAKTATGATSAGAVAAQSDGVASAPTTTVKATGGGKFCELIGGAMKGTASAAPTSGADPKAEIDAAHKAADQALNLAPAAIKSDVKVLVSASDAVYAALAKAGYDESKVTSADMAVYSTPQVMAAEQHLLAYVKGTCGIDLGGGATAPADSGAPAIDSATGPAASDPAGASGSACALVTVAEATAAAGQPMAQSGDAGSICTFSATADASFVVYVQVYNDEPAMVTIKAVEPLSGTEHLTGMGDDAFWNATLGTVFVQKGTRAFSLGIPSLANLTADPDARKANMVTLAKAALARF